MFNTEVLHGVKAVQGIDTTQLFTQSNKDKPSTDDILKEISTYSLFGEKMYSDTFVLVRGLRKEFKGAEKLVELIHKLIFLGFNIVVDSSEENRGWVLETCGIEINNSEFTTFDVVLLADSHTEIDDACIALHMMGREICHFPL